MRDQRNAAGFPFELFEREGELEAIRQLLEQTASGDGRIAVIAASEGMGKTQLLRAAVEEADGAGVRPLVARATELETEFAFGVARQLIEKPLAECPEPTRARLLTGAASQATAALGLREASSVEPDLWAGVHGLHWLTVNLSGSAPLLLAVDDLEWVDGPSLLWLSYFARRSEGLPIGLLVTVGRDVDGRLGSAGMSEQARRAARELITHDRATRLEPVPLSLDASTRLLEEALGRPPEPGFSLASHERTGGNPLFLTELANEVASAGLAPTQRNAASLRDVVPDAVAELVSRRLLRLDERAGRLAASIAILGEAGGLAMAADLADLTLEEAADLAGRLIEAQLLHDARTPRFRHELLQEAVASRASELEASFLHRRAAHLLAEGGEDPGRVASHLLRSIPSSDAWSVEVLLEAACRARRQGAPEEAGSLLRRALEEPPTAELRPAVLQQLGAAELAALNPHASEHLEAALELTTDATRRVDIALNAAVAHVYAGRHRKAVEILLRAIEEIRDDPDLREQWLALEAFLAIAGRYDLATKPITGERVHELASQLEGVTAGEQLLLSVAGSERPGPTAADLYAATRRGDELVGRCPWPDPAAGVGTIAMYLHADHPVEARQLAERLLAESVERGSPFRYALGLAGRGMVALETGELRAAAADLSEALTLADELNAPIAPLAGYVVRALAERGASSEGEDLLSERRLDGELPEQMLLNSLLYGRGMLRLLARRWRDAELDFRELGRRHARWGISRPSPPWRSACALALLATGDEAPALALAKAELDVAREWGSPRAIAIAKRAHALARGGERGIEELHEAVELLEGTPWRLDRARVRCDLGAALRRAGRRSAGRTALTTALDEAHRCGAETLAQLVEAELRASGARPRRRPISGFEALTASELRVCRLAAEGRSNRAIAQELFVTTATIETHLTRAYRKLDVSGRAELPAALDHRPGG